MTAAPDRSLERYEIVDRIAVGGMAEVFRAKAFGAHGFEKTLAIKRILPDLANDPEFEERFIQEAKLAVQLAHANIVQVFDFGRFGGSLFIAMEYVDGLDLAGLIREIRKRKAQIPISAALHIGVELFKGLDYAHQRGVVHRDVSPSNILLSRSGEVRIADFGIAQAELDRTGADKQRRIMGKWRYMSPEQAMGEELSAQSDLFSAAVVMFEVFTAEKLFPGDEAEDVLDNIRHMPIPKVTDLRGSLPQRLDEVLGEILQREPGDRPLRAAVIQRALTEISYDSSIVATAMDVADTVASILGEQETEAVSASGASRGLDDLIRQQIGGDGDGDSGSIAVEPTQLDDGDRHTEEASLLQTFVRKGVDPDGVTQWEIEGATIAAIPSAIRGERSGAARASKQVAAADEPPDRRKSLLWLLAGGAVAVAGAAFVVFVGGSSDGGGSLALSTDEDAGAGSLASRVDAAIGRIATLRIESSPPGARVEVDGIPQGDVTPLDVQVAPNEPHTVTFTLEGYRRHEEQVSGVGAGRNLLVSETLQAERGSLTVRTKPSGATVELAGVALGETPLVDHPLAPGARQPLVITKSGYKKLEVAVDVYDGRNTEINRTLQSDIEYGTVDIAISGTWAYVYYRNKKIGRAPGRGFKLPVGKQRIRLENDVTKKTKTVTIEVFADKVELYKLEL